MKARSRKDGPDEKPLPAPGTEGLDRLDEDRAGSLADEGGASAAHTETQESDPAPEDVRRDESVEGKARR